MGSEFARLLKKKHKGCGAGKNGQRVVERKKPKRKREEKN